jgi:hypothetical protein
VVKRLGEAPRLLDLRILVGVPVVLDGAVVRLEERGEVYVLVFKVEVESWGFAEGLGLGGQIQREHNETRTPRPPTRRTVNGSIKIGFAASLSPKLL